ncbi:hypothetical protein D3C73_837540 [compost metagenome]
MNERFEIFVICISRRHELWHPIHNRRLGIRRGLSARGSGRYAAVDRLHSGLAAGLIYQD